MKFLSANLAILFYWISITFLLLSVNKNASITQYHAISPHGLAGVFVLSGAPVYEKFEGRDVEL